jgi:hypothetical protein
MPPTKIITGPSRSDYGGTGAPSGSGYTKIYSTMRAFAAVKADGSIKVWGGSGHGDTSAPSRIWVTPRCDWAIGFKSGEGIEVRVIWRIIISTIIIIGTRGIYLSKAVWFICNDEI